MVRHFRTEVQGNGPHTIVHNLIARNVVVTVWNQHREDVPFRLVNLNENMIEVAIGYYQWTQDNSTTSGDMTWIDYVQEAEPNYMVGVTA